MTSIRRHLCSLSTAAVLAVATASYGQHMDQLRARTDAGFEAARLATRTSFEALAGYPKDVRDAILTLSTRPELIVKLFEASAAGTPSADAIATPHGSDVMLAARVVTARPALLKTLVERLPVVTLIGQCAGDQIPAIRTILDREAEARTTQSRSLVDAWRKRVTAKPQILGQLRGAAADFKESESVLQPLTGENVMLADHPGSPAAEVNSDSSLDYAAAITQRVVKPLPADLDNPTSGFGFTAAGPSPVVGIPGHDEVYFTLVHSDKYPELAAAIVEQWYYEPNPNSFRAAVDKWYTNYQETLPQSLGGQGEYLPGILKERILFEKRYIAAMRDPANPRLYRLEFLEANLKDYPALNRVRDNDIIAKLNVTPDRVTGGPVSKSTRSGSGGGSSSSGQSSSSTNRSSGRGATNRGGRSTSGSDVTGMASSSRNTRGNNRSNNNSRFGNSNSGSGQGNFGSSNNRRSGGFGSGSSGFGSGSSGFGSGSSGFGSGSSGFGSGSSGFGSGSSGFGSSRSSGSSRFGSGSSSSRSNN